MVRAAQRSGPKPWADCHWLTMMGTTDLKAGLCRIVRKLAKSGISLSQARQEFERQFIIESIRLHEGNLSRSARSMGIHRNTLRNKMISLGLDADS